MSKYSEYYSAMTFQNMPIQKIHTTIIHAIDVYYSTYMLIEHLERIRKYKHQRIFRINEFRREDQNIHCEEIDKKRYVNKTNVYI